MTYTKEQFIDDVKAEAKALREHATKEELGRLDFNNLDPNDKRYCIYGLMTGNCNSERAIELITKCCTRYFHNNDVMGNMSSFEIAAQRVNGGTCDLASARGLEIRYFSSIETYIFFGDRKRNLIAYLRGETDDLNL